MYSRQETTDLRRKFWTSLGKYLAPIPSASGKKINWINYKTGIRFIHFKMDVTLEAYIGIEITHDNSADRKLYYEQFLSLKKPLEMALGEKWVWQEVTEPEEEASIARIFTTLGNVNIYDPGSWPGIISFFKQRLLGLDKFWQEYRIVFEMTGEPRV
jgi:hypothetical protein